MNDATGMPQNVLVLGGTSEIARAILRELSTRRLESVMLAGRNPRPLEAAARELTALGVPRVEVAALDVTAIGTLETFADQALARLGAIDLVIVAAGELGTAELTELDATVVASLVTTNFAGPAAAMTALARVLCAQGHGRFLVLSSVAGYRVRAANLVYGSAKAGLDGFALGLSDALFGSGVEVTVVRSGFVRTKMTQGRKAAPFSVDASAVAKASVRALETGATVVWVPGALRFIFGILGVAPRAIWRRLPG